MNIPKSLPVFKREVQNNMYSPSVCYFSMITVCIMTYWWYPLALTSLSIWFYGLQSMDFVGFCEWWGVITAATFVGSSFGFTMGCIFPKYELAQMVVIQFINFFNMGAGFMQNSKTKNVFIQFASWVSPMHYATELLMRRILKGRTEVIQTTILDTFDYTNGILTCYLVLISFYIIFTILGWVALKHIALK